MGRTAVPCTELLIDMLNTMLHWQASESMSPMASLRHHTRLKPSRPHFRLARSSYVCCSKTTE